MAASQGCQIDSDDHFGPRVSGDCRSFDFTLLFEDIFFIALPALLLLLLLPPRLHFLRSASVKVQSYELAIWKLSLLAVLFVLHVLFAAFQARTSALGTRASLASGIINVIATFAAACASVIEDQRSIKPSDILVIYFSASSVLALPRLRSLWLMSSVNACGALWTSIWCFTVAMLLVESARKTKLLRLQYQIVTKEQLCGFWGRSFFIWALPFFQIGYSKVLSIDDIPDVDNDLQGQTAEAKLEAAWEIANGKHRLLRATFRAYLWPCLSAIPPRLALATLTFAQPFLITATIDYMGSSPTTSSKHYGQALIGAYVLVYLGIAVSTAVYWRQTYRLNTMIRSGLISMIYSQTVSLRADDPSDSAAITLMGTDVERTVTSLRPIHESWASILEVGIAIWLLERQLWVACIVPLIISLGSVLAMVPVSTRSGEAQKQWIERVQMRLTITSSMLNDMKAVKMLGLADILSTIVTNLRKTEISTSVRFRKLLIWQVALCKDVPNEMNMKVFAIYAIISVIRQDGSLLSAQAFTSLALISLLTSPLLTYCQSMPSLLQAVSCFNRIEEYCELKSASSSGPSTSAVSIDEPSNAEMELRSRQTSHTTSSPLMFFKDATISRSPDSEAVLHRLNLSIWRGITVIIGPVGCGKTTLIETILGGNTLRSGSATAPLSRVAYCPQKSWIINDTIQQNIIGATEFDQKWYDFTLSVCGLEEDFKAVPTNTRNSVRMAGSNGIALSGGQKQRVALARAVYSKLKVVVLDDIFSGLDTKSIALISDRLFSKTGHFRKAGISAILATNAYHVLPYADDIIMLDEGRVIDNGIHEAILARAPEITTKSGTTVEDDSALRMEQSSTRQTLKGPEEIAANITEAELNEDTNHIRQQGALSVYLYYFRSAGYINLAIFAAFTVIEAFSSSFGAIWLQWWVEANEQQPNKQLGMYLGVYALIFALSLLSLVAGCWILFVRILNNTSRNLHCDLLMAALRAPFSFFQTTDTGSTINRFSQDMELIDMMLPIYAVNFATESVTCVIKLIILCTIGKYLAGSVPFLAVVLFFVQSYYLRTSRQGISTIRAFNWECQYREVAQRLLNQSQKPAYMLFCIQQWLTLVLDLVVGAIAVILVAMIVSLKDRFSAASIGVALNLLLTFNQTLTQAIKMWTMMETSIGAVSRIQRFVRDTPSEGCCLTFQPPPLPPEWPSHGAIEFEDVTAGYSQAEAPVLKHVNLTMHPGQKSAVCGSSGSGKTSLIMVLLQMLKIQEGSVKIDGRVISTIQQSDLRACFNVIPQDPFFLPGTTRFNLDPHRRVSDEHIESAIKKVGLWNRLSANGGLDMEFLASQWSVGQKQLLALARALIVQSPVLILDEATSNVDWETESIMQEIIDREFARQTVIAVVHHFRYIDRFSHVVLLKNGELVEYDSWKALLKRDSEFKKLYLALQKS